MPPKRVSNRILNAGVGGEIIAEGRLKRARAGTKLDKFEPPLPTTATTTTIRRRARPKKATVAKEASLIKETKEQTPEALTTQSEAAVSSPFLTTLLAKRIKVPPLFNPNERALYKHWVLINIIPVINNVKKV